MRVQRLERDLELFDLERLAAVVQAHRHESVERVRDEVLTAVDAFSPRQQDDITLLVLRHS